MKNKLTKFYYKYISETSLLKDNAVFSLVVFFPASIITSILIIPCVIISYPFLLVFRKQRNQEKIMRFFLYIQNILGFSGLYILEELFWSKSLQWSDVLVSSLFAFIVFYNSIKELVNENLESTRNIK